MHFSLRLLWEGFQQCKMIGIFSAVIVVLGAVLEPVAQAISLGSSPHYTKVVYEAWGINARSGWHTVSTASFLFSRNKMRQEVSAFCMSPFGSASGVSNKT